MSLSTVPAGVVAEALGYLREGNPVNLRELAAFLSDTVLLTGEGFAPPQITPAYGRHTLPEARQSPAAPPTPQTPPAPQIPPVPQTSPASEASLASAAPPASAAPTVAVVFYRAHELSGNTGFVDALWPGHRRPGRRPAPGVLRFPALSRRGPDRAPGPGPGRHHTGPGGRRLGRGRHQRRRRLGRRRPGHPGRAHPPRPVPDLLAGAVAGRGRRAEPDRRGHAGRDPRVRRPTDHGAVLVQGGGPGRHRGLRRRPGAGRAAGRDRGPAGEAGRHPELGQARRDHAVLVPRPRMPGSATRSAWTPRLRPFGCCRPCARPATTSATASPRTATRSSTR